MVFTFLTLFGLLENLVIWLISMLAKKKKKKKKKKQQQKNWLSNFSNNKLRKVFLSFIVDTTAETLLLQGLSEPEGEG